MRPLGLLIALLASCAEERAEPPAKRQAIIGGQEDLADVEVFLLGMSFDTGTNTICSATLIGNRSLLTAAHCVDPARQSASTVTVRATNKASAAQATSSDFIDVSEVRMHPSWSPSAQTSPNDIALLLLAAPPTGVSPKPWNSAALSGFAGRPMRVVGYGRTDAATSNGGTRRAVTLNAAAVDSSYIDFGASGVEGICAGDSGGPSLHLFSDGVERLVGVHSYQSSPQCGDGSDVRVDPHAAFIQQWLDEKEPAQCARDGSCQAACTPADPDCVAEGQPCASDAQCETRRCVSDSQSTTRFCSRACAQSSECPSPMTCTGGVCLHAQGPLPELGEACQVGQACAAGSVCSGPVGLGTTCRLTCETDGGCAAGAECVDGEGGQRYCRAMGADGGQSELDQVNGCTCTSVRGAELVALLFVLIGATPCQRRRKDLPRSHSAGRRRWLRTPSWRR